jgi:hypothetical protein
MGRGQVKQHCATVEPEHTIKTKRMNMTPWSTMNPFPTSAVVALLSNHITEATGEVTS